MAPDNPNPSRLYTRFISILKILQYFGYFIVVFFNVIVVFLTRGGALGGFPLIAIIPLVLQVLVGCAIVYVITQGLIALIDLLSRIEHNTRPL
jgi:hypothetical protein